MVLAKMEHRGWVLLAIMLAASLLWLNPKVTLGVAVGGVLALYDFRLMRKVLAPVVEKGGGKGVLFVIQILKYLVMGVVLGTLFWFKVVNPIASVVGLSIMFLIPVLYLLDAKSDLEEVA